MAPQSAAKCATSSTAVLICIIAAAAGQGMLYPRSSESRVVKTLDGMWSFRLDDSPSRNAGFNEQWWKQPLKQVGRRILVIQLSCIHVYR